MTITYPNFKVSTLPYKTLLLALLLLKSVILIGFILYGNIGLGPDEAQYWTWSQKLDGGYYSKPPGIAWQIWLGTYWWGNSELGVRFLSVIIGMMQAFAVYYLAINCKLEARTAFWCAIAMAFSPLGVIGSVLAITDVGFLLFWTIACIMIAAALKNNQAPNTYLIGLTIAAGALFKWPIYLFWIFFFLFRYWYFSFQNLKKGLIGISISLLGLLPSIWWNWSHNWVTFRHVFSTMKGGNSAVVKGNFFEFIGAQLLLLSPIFFFLFLIAAYQWFKKRSVLNPALFFCGTVSLVVLGGYCIASLFQKIQGNWGIFAYPTSIVLMGWYVCEWNPVRFYWMKWGTYVSLFIIGLLMILPLVSSINTFKHNIGWDELQKGLDEGGYQADQHFLVGDTYQTTSLLSFYNTGKKRAYFLNLQGARQNQFSYWPSLQEEQKGKVGYFVRIEHTPHLHNHWEKTLVFYQQELPKYFEKVEFAGFLPLTQDKNHISKAAFIFKCSGCKNFQLQESDLY